MDARYARMFVMTEGEIAAESPRTRLTKTSERASITLTVETRRFRPAGRPEVAQTAFFSKREKMYKQHADSYQYYGDVAGRERLLDSIKEMKIEAVDEAFTPVGASWKVKTRTVRPYRLLKAQFNDPVCVFGVLELLLESQEGIYIRPEYLDVLLSRQYPLYYWPVSTIGRILSGLWQACATEYNSDYPAPFAENELPFAKGRDAKGKYY